MTVCANRARRVSASARGRAPGAGAGRSKGLSRTPSAPRCRHAPPVAAARRAYSSSGSMIQHSRALVGVAQDFELGEVGLPGAGGGEGDGVVVVLRPPVPGDQARPGGVRAVQDAGQRVGVGGVAGQVGGGERERRRQRGGVHRPGELQGVGAGGEGGDPALQGAEGGRGGDQQQRAGHRADRRDLPGEVVFAGGVDGEVQAEAEQLALAAGEPVRQVAGVARGGLGVRVIELAAVRAGAAPRFQPGPLPAQPVGCRGRGDRVDVQGDVEAAGVGQQRLQPPGGDFGGVPGDREGRGVVVADRAGAGRRPRRPAARAPGPRRCSRGAGRARRRRARVRVMAGSPGW